MAYARGVGGRPPASRYMDILALGVLVNLLTFHFICQSWYGLSNWLKSYVNIYASLWKMLVIFGISGLMVMGSWPQIQQRSLQYAEQLKNTREFLKSGRLSVFQNKPRLSVPYPKPKLLADWLSNPQIRAILPHTLKVPSLLQSSQNSTFVINGFFPTTKKYLNESTLGSYNHLGDKATGRFESNSIKLEHSFMEIPVAGFLGQENLKLQMEVEGQEPISITPPKLAKQSWVSCYVRTPNQPFKLVAIDQSTEHWFAFAMPRSLGTLSFLTIWILKHGWMIFIIGIALLSTQYTFIISAKD